MERGATVGATMGLWTKKKDETTQSIVPTPPAAAAPPAPAATPQPTSLSKDTESRIDVALGKELGEVERSIDLFVSRDSRPGILDRYKEKYGEDLDLPRGVDAYRHEYLEPELVEKAVTDDIAVGDFSFTKPAESAAATVTATEGTTTTSAPAAASKTPGAVAKATSVPADKSAGITPKRAPAAKSLFARKPAAEKAAKAAPVVPSEPGWGFALPEHLTTFEKITKGLPGLFLDWTCLPFYKYAKAREAYRNTLYLYILLDLGALLAPAFLPLIAKLLLGWIMPAYRWNRRRGGHVAAILAEKKRRAAAEAAAKAAAPAASE